MQLNICWRFLPRSGFKVQSVPLKGVQTRTFWGGNWEVFCACALMHSMFSHTESISGSDWALVFFLSSWSLGRISPDDGKGKMFLFVTICVCVWLLVWFYFFLFFPCWVKGELGIGGEEIAPFLGCCTSLGTSSVPRCPICAEPCCWLISSLERAWTGFNVIP